MTKLLGLIIYTGAACVSPIEPMADGTVAYKTPCAEIVQVQSANPYKIAQRNFYALRRLERLVDKRLGERAKGSLI